jgi:hypothetical protein
MGVGGGFWDSLKPIAQFDDLDHLKGKRVAIVIYAIGNYS